MEQSQVASGLGYEQQAMGVEELEASAAFWQCGLVLASTVISVCFHVWEAMRVIAPSTMSSKDDGV
jgi:hypothetical protein